MITVEEASKAIKETTRIINENFRTKKKISFDLEVKALDYEYDSEVILVDFLKKNKTIFLDSNFFLYKKESEKLEYLKLMIWNKLYSIETKEILSKVDGISKLGKDGLICLYFIDKYRIENIHKENSLSLKRAISSKLYSYLRGSFFYKNNMSFKMALFYYLFEDKNSVDEILKKTKDEDKEIFKDFINNFYKYINLINDISSREQLIKVYGKITKFLSERIENDEDGEDKNDNGFKNEDQDQDSQNMGESLQRIIEDDSVMDEIDNAIDQATSKGSNGNDYLIKKGIIISSQEIPFIESNQNDKEQISISNSLLNFLKGKISKNILISERKTSKEGVFSIRNYLNLNKRFSGNIFTKNKMKNSLSGSKISLILSLDNSGSMEINDRLQRQSVLANNIVNTFAKIDNIKIKLSASIYENIIRVIGLEKEIKPVNFSKEYFKAFPMGGTNILGNLEIFNAIELEKSSMTYFHFVITDDDMHPQYREMIRKELNAINKKTDDNYYLFMFILDGVSSNGVNNSKNYFEFAGSKLEIEEIFKLINDQKGTNNDLSK